MPCGDEVRCLVRSPAAAGALEALGCTVVPGHLGDRSALETLVAGVAIVYHVAGRVAARSEADFLGANGLGTAEVARAALAAGVPRLLYVSSLAVTGPTVPGRPLDEKSPPHPVTAYGRSKRAGEDAVRAAGLPFTIVRPPAVYGPRDRAFLGLFRLARGGFAPLLGDGRQELSLVHGADLAQALIAAATSAATLGGTYHAAHPELVTQRQLVEAIGRAMGRRVLVAPIPKAIVRLALHALGLSARIAGRTTILDPAKAPELLAPAWTCSSLALERDAGWKAQVPLDTGVADTAAWYRREGWI